jgi:tetratricopeptide (TPR) repeat protein
LQQIDAANKNPDAVMAKFNLAMNYHVHTIRYHLFAFADLREGENVDDLKKSASTLQQPHFEVKIDSVLMSLIRHYPEDGRLYKALGDYYYAVYKSYGDQWFISARQLLEESYLHLLKAYGLNCTDAQSLYVLGYYNSLFESYHEAEMWYLRSLQLNPHAPLVYYNLGVNYLLNKQAEKGIQPMEEAFKLFNDSLKKSDAARVLGIMYYKSKNKEQALVCFELADAFSPAYHPTQMFLLRSRLQMNQVEQALKLAKIIFDQAPFDPDVPDELLEMFRMEGKGDLLANLFENLMKEYRGQHEAIGNVRFHYGKLLYLEGEPAKSLRMFKKSYNSFKKVLPANHHVFDMLEEMMIRIRKLNA